MDALKNSSEHGQLIQAVENFINSNPDKYNFNSEQDKEKLVNDLKDYLSKEGLVGNKDNTKGIIFSAVVFTFVVISLVIVVVYGATHDTASATEYYYRSYTNDSNREIH